MRLFAETLVPDRPHRQPSQIALFLRPLATAIPGATAAGGPDAAAAEPAKSAAAAAAQTATTAAAATANLDEASSPGRKFKQFQESNVRIYRAGQ